MVIGDVFGATAKAAQQVAMKACNDLVNIAPSSIFMPGQAEAREISRAFGAMRRGMPFLSNIIGCLDGTFAATLARHPERGVYYGYKHSFASTLILAVCDSSLRFRWISADKPA